MTEKRLQEIERNLHKMSVSQLQITIGDLILAIRTMRRVERQSKEIERTPVHRTEPPKMIPTPTSCIASA